MQSRNLAIQVMDIVSNNRPTMAVSYPQGATHRVASLDKDYTISYQISVFNGCFV